MSGGTRRSENPERGTLYSPLLTGIHARYTTNDDCVAVENAAETIAIVLIIDDLQFR